VLTTSLVFAIDQAVAGRVEVYDRATLTLQRTHAVAPAAPTYPGHYGGVYGDLVLICDTARLVNVFDAATGDLLARPAVATSPRDIAGVRNGEVVISGSPNNNYLNITSETYVVDLPAPAPDYTGFSLRVAQISATVGAGFPASITI
jgi:hypothetical protein